MGNDLIKMSGAYNDPKDDQIKESPMKGLIKSDPASKTNPKMTASGFPPQPDVFDPLKLKLGLD